MCGTTTSSSLSEHVSVLFNEPKLLKFNTPIIDTTLLNRFSALQRAEIAEIIQQIEAYLMDK